MFFTFPFLPRVFVSSLLMNSKLETPGTYFVSFLSLFLVIEGSSHRVGIALEHLIIRPGILKLSSNPKRTSIPIQIHIYNRVMASTTSIPYPGTIDNTLSNLVFSIGGAVLVVILIFVCCGYGCMKKRKLQAQIRKEAKLAAKVRRDEEFALISVPSRVYSSKYWFVHGERVWGMGYIEYGEKGLWGRWPNRITVSLAGKFLIMCDDVERASEYIISGHKYEHCTSSTYHYHDFQIFRHFLRGRADFFISGIIELRS